MSVHHVRSVSVVGVAVPPAPPAARLLVLRPSRRENVTPAPNRELLEQQPPHYLAHGHRTRADLRLLKIRDIVWVAKDFSACPWWFRNTVGRWLVMRELRALRRLRDLDGVPQGAVRIDAHAFAYRYVEGVALSSVDSRHLCPDFFERYEELVECMHRLGVVHLGLHPGSNVLVTPDLQPVILDFQTHLYLPRWLSRLLAVFAHLDFNAINRVWTRYMLDTLREEQRVTGRPEH